MEIRRLRFRQQMAEPLGSIYVDPGAQDGL
jgi:hypothetical protein